MIEKTNGRPLVGFIVLNESFIDYNSRDYNSDLNVFVHELFHTIFFDPELFAQHYPAHSDGPFYFDDSGTKKLRGTACLSVLRSHFNCPSANGSKHVHIFGILVSSLLEHDIGQKEFSVGFRNNV